MAAAGTKLYARVGVWVGFLPLEEAKAAAQQPQAAMALAGLKPCRSDPWHLLLPQVSAGWEAGADLGPVISKDALKRIEGLIQSGIKQARALCARCVRFACAPQ